MPLPRLRLLCIALAALAASAAFAAAPYPPGPARSAIEQFLLAHSAGAPGKVTVKIETPAAGPLAACDAPEPFLPAGATAWGRVSVGVRCPGERPWTRYVPAHVAVQGRYLVSAGAIDAGRTLGAQDVAERSGDLTALPRSVLTDAAQIAGTVAVNRIAAGAPLRREMLRGAVVIQQGQTVRLLAQGDGFVVSTEGRAMVRASVGATLQVKTADGRLVTGVAGEDGHVRLAQ